LLPASRLLSMGCIPSSMCRCQELGGKKKDTQGWVVIKSSRRCRALVLDLTLLYSTATPSYMAAPLMYNTADYQAHTCGLM
jgi:hypothetical protein